LFLQAVLAAPSKTASKRRCIEADKRIATISSNSPPSINRAYGSFIFHVCFLSLYEVAAKARSSDTTPTLSSLNDTVNQLRNDAA
jgi:hypothetical protein